MVFVFYTVSFWAIEHRRNRLGPWQVTFTHNRSRLPEIHIDQPNLGVTNVSITFLNAGATSTDMTLVASYAQPRPVPYPVPFGRCLFMDTTTLPGTVAFELFGHEIQLLPRALTVDKQERVWHSGETIVLNSTNGQPEAPVRN